MDAATNICDLCGKKFSQKRYLDRHKNRCAVSYLRSVPLPCTVCGKEFLRSSHLQRHQRTHLNIRNPCPFCDDSFSQKCHLKRHLSAKHREEAKTSATTRSLIGETTLFACIKCPENSVKSFPTRWELCRHQRLVHVTELNCSICETEKRRTVTFETYEAWKVHVEYHKGKRPYICDICWRSFGQKLDLENHMAAVHEKVGRFQCSVCENVFVQRTQVDRHLFKQHIQDEELNKFQCRPCAESFDAEKFLIQHLRLRHQFLEKILFCKYCNDWFLDKVLLANHTNIHFRKLKAGIPLNQIAEPSQSTLAAEAKSSEEETTESNSLELQFKIKISKLQETERDSLKLSHKLPKSLLAVLPQLEKFEIKVNDGLRDNDTLVVNVPISNKAALTSDHVTKLVNCQFEISYP